MQSRYRPISNPIVLYLIFAMMAIGLLVDLSTPLGYSDWVIYFIPIAATIFLWRPKLPFAVAAAATGFIIVGYLFGPLGIDPRMSLVNRFACSVTLWIFAAVIFQAVRTKLDLKKQEWLQRGQTRLNEEVVGEKQLKVLAEHALKLIAEYLGADAGAIYSKEKDFLQCAARYVTRGGGDVPDRIVLGEGLVGQCAKDKRVFSLQAAPGSYLKVVSALGETDALSILVAPMMVDDSVLAVLELGFLHGSSPEDEEFLKGISESFAVAIRSANYREHLAQLLEETQRQAEELQMHSEELRVTNEELEEQGRALSESHQRLEQQQAELEQTNVQLEEQTQLLEGQKDELERAAGELEQASHYKSQFLANMSHELRTPLNSTLILAQLLAENKHGNLSAEQVKFANTILSSGRDLLNLITDVLDLSKIEAGGIILSLENVSLDDVLSRLRNAFEPMAKEKGLDLRLQSAQGTPRFIETDTMRLEQILKNLLSNAIKFTDQGGIWLNVESGPEGGVHFKVKDTGIGIGAEQQQLVFEAFRQVDGAANRKYAGTGLGLSISNQLAHLLGGDLRVESELGSGTTFTLVIPHKLTTQKWPPPQFHLETKRLPSPDRMDSTAISRGLKDDRASFSPDKRILLIVEDDQPFASILLELAHEMGFQCLMASTAEEARLLTLQYLPSAIILDIGLPDDSGLSVLQRLKQDPRVRHIPVHVLSASDYSETALKIGAVGYMLKPVKREDLINIFRGLENHLSKKLRRVLVVNDEPEQRQILESLLGSNGITIATAGSAAECLERLRSETFDCMVLDLTLPDATGLELLKTLEKEEQYSFPPVIVYTGRELSEDEEFQLRKYSKSIVIKGAKSPERLLDEVTLFLHLVVSELPADSQSILRKAMSRDSMLEGRHILVVEDDVRNVFALTSLLEPKGVSVSVARNGREALEFLERSQSSNVKVDLVLMDIMMPEMDGITATQEIRKRREWKSLPIIALTAKAMKTDREKCLNAGVSDYVSKPLDVEKLLSLIRVWMSR